MYSITLYFFTYAPTNAQPPTDTSDETCAAGHMDVMLYVPTTMK